MGQAIFSFSTLPKHIICQRGNQSGKQYKSRATNQPPEKQGILDDDVDSSLTIITQITDGF